MMDKSSYLIEHFHHGFAYWIYALMGLASAFLWLNLSPKRKESRWRRWRSCLKNSRSAGGTSCPQLMPFHRGGGDSRRNGD